MTLVIALLLAVLAALVYQLFLICYSNSYSLMLLITKLKPSFWPARIKADEWYGGYCPTYQLHPGSYIACHVVVLIWSWHVTTAEVELSTFGFNPLNNFWYLLTFIELSMLLHEIDRSNCTVIKCYGFWLIRSRSPLRIGEKLKNVLQGIYQQFFKLSYNWSKIWKMVALRTV